MADGWNEMAGLWQLDRSENFDDYLKELGVNFMIRKMAGAAKGQVKITVEGDRITIQSLSSMKQMAPNTFIVNGPTTDTDYDGKNAKARTQWINGTLVIDVSPTADGGIKHAQKITRQIVNGELVQTMEVNNVKCTRIYKRA